MVNGKRETGEKKEGTEAYKEQRKVFSPIFRKFEDRSERLRVLNGVMQPPYTISYMWFLYTVCDASLILNMRFFLCFLK
jgi:hypothetical protein